MGPLRTISSRRPVILAQSLQLAFGKIAVPLNPNANICSFLRSAVFEQ